MMNVTVDEFQRDPAKYLRQVEAGKTFVILQADNPIAELRPIASSRQSQLFGLSVDDFTVLPIDFNAVLPDELFGASEGK